MKTEIKQNLNPVGVANQAIRWVKNKIIAEKSLPIPNTREYRRSGIYIYERTDADGITWFYCGQAVDIYNRAVSHATAYDHLGISLRKRGYKSEDNPFGWEFRVVEFCSEEELDDMEHYHIINNMRLGKQAYNVTSGKQGQGKQTFDTRKPARGYRDGVKQGERNVIKKIAHWFDKHLKAVPKVDKPSKNAIKALDQFNQLLQGETDND